MRHFLKTSFGPRRLRSRRGFFGGETSTIFENQILKRNFMQNDGGGASPTLMAS